MFSQITRSLHMEQTADALAAALHLTAAPPPIAPKPAAEPLPGLTMVPGSAARTAFSDLVRPLHLERASADAFAAALGADEGWLRYWAPRLGETVIGGLAVRGVKLGDFRWLMELGTLELRDGQVRTGSFCGVAADGSLHVCFRKEDGGTGTVWHAAMPASAVRASAATAPSPEHLPQGKALPVLDFPAESGLRRATGLVLAADQLAGLTADWMAFWRPAVDAAAGKAGQEFALGRLTASTLQAKSFGLKRLIDDAVVFFRPAEAGIEFFPEPDLQDAALLEWGSGDGSLELLYRGKDGLPTIWQVSEHVPAGGSAALPSCLPQLHPGTAARSETLPSQRALDQGVFEFLWDGDTEPSSRVVSRCGDTLALEDPHGGERVQFERGFICDQYAVAATAEGRCARLTLGAPSEVASLARFAPSAECWGPWKDGSAGCAVLILPADALDARTGATEAAPLPGKLAVTPEAFSVGPFQAAPLRADDRITLGDWKSGIGCLDLQPGGAGPGEAAPTVRMLLPSRHALRVLEEWDVAHTRAALSKESMGGYYRSFNEAKKLNLLVVLFADVVLLNQALNKDVSLEDTIERLAEPGDKALSDEALRQAVVAKILALVQMLPGIKQKLELMASMYPYYWVHQEVEWLRSAFGPAAAAAIEPSLRRRAVPLVRREVRAVQANLGRALAEIEAAARPIDALLARNEVRSSWTAQARHYLPLAMQGASALSMIVLSRGVYGWSGLASFLVSGVAGNVLDGVTQDAEAMNQVARAAQSILPWWRVFLHVLVTTQFEFGQFVDDENMAAMKRDRALLDKVPAADRPAATNRLAAALRRRILEERRSRFAEVLAGSGVLIGRVADELANAITNSAHTDVAEFIKMFQPVPDGPKPDHPEPD